MLSEDNGNVNGKLVFDNYQKDGSRGFVKGKLENNILKLWYNFQSEGMNSVMQVWYKKEGPKLFRGVGSVDVKADTSYFLNPKDIQYDSGQTLIEIDCEDIPGKYK